MKYFSFQNIPYYKFSNLEQFSITHATFTRKGGNSAEPFSHFNASISVGDCQEKVQNNLQIVMDILHLQHLVIPKQMHGTQIEEIKKKPLHNPSCDALITDEPSIGLAVTHADCQGVLFYDPINHVVAAAHVGWRGNVSNLLAKVVERLQHRFNCCPENLYVGITPSLGPDHAEFVNYRKEFPKIFWAYQAQPNYFDLWKISRMQLQTAGILPQHIEIAEKCTYCDPETYFSYRRDKVTGRMITVISLIP